jgi:AmpE protein
MNLLALVLVLWVRQAGLLAEPAAMIAGLMRNWRDGWMQRGGRETWSAAVVLACIVLPPVVLTVAALSPLHGLWHLLLATTVSGLVMLLVLLDRARPDAAMRARTAWAERDWAPATVGMAPDFAALGASVDDEFGRARRHVLEQQLHELFTPLFWFLLLGPAAAMAAYFFRLCAEDGDGAVAIRARGVLHYVEWPVVRVLALSFALAGNFMATWQQLRPVLFDAGMPPLQLLEESADAAQPVTLAVAAESAPDEVLAHALDDVVALLQRALLIWVVLLALHTLWP